jgi:predicted CXXCH cytochrome family protein
MQRTIIGFLIFAGFSLVIFSTAILSAQDDDDPAQAEYYGEDDCRDCHRDLARSHRETVHALALREAEEGDEDEPGSILADFDSGEDVRTVTFPGDDEARPFDADDIVWVIGAGRYAQRYVTELDDGRLVVLPAEWVTAEGTWRPFDLGEEWATSSTYDFLPNCAGCHTTGLDLEKGEWIDVGVQCESCHGPGSVHVDRADEASRRPDAEELAYIRSGIIVSPSAEICGQCHSQGTATADGLPVWLGFRPGYERLLDGFEIVASDDPFHWWASSHARQTNMQFNEWLTSAHVSALETLWGSDFAEDACLECHSTDYTFAQGRITRFEEEELDGDPPLSIDLSNAENGVTCVSCHSPHFAAEEAGFFLVDEPYALCTDCHTDADASDNIHHPVQQMFEGQTLIATIEGVPSRHFREEDGPECVTCHMTDVLTDGVPLANHTFSLVQPASVQEGLGSDSCGQCHQNLTATDLQVLIDDTQSVVESRIEDLTARLESVQEMELDEDGMAALEEATAALRFVQGDGSRGVHNFTYADQLLTASEEILVGLSAPEVSAAPTEGPTPIPDEVTAVADPEAEPERVSSGYQPITWIIMGLSVFILVVAGLAFFRKRPDDAI